MNKHRNILISIFLLVSILFTTVVYSAFSTQLQINGEAVVRSKSDIRITNINIINQVNGSYETYNNKFTKDTTSMFVTLPSNSSIKYEIEITNKSNTKYYVNSIIRLSHTNSNIKIDITLSKNDVIQNNSIKTFTITITNDTNKEQIESLVYEYKFLGDNAVPTLALEKWTYTVENFDTWTLTDAHVEDNTLMLDGEYGVTQAESGYIFVNGGKWKPVFDVYTESISKTYDPDGGIEWASYYYNSNYKTVKTLADAVTNEWAWSVKLNTWTTIDWFIKNKDPDMTKNLRYGPDVIYVKLIYGTSSNMSPQVMIRNLRIYGEKIPNSFYLIYVTSSDDTGIVSTKYAKGEHDSSYFHNNGIEITESKIRVEENGIYTVYVSDIVGNETIETIEITNIE